jgi:hypothetical protein
LLLTRGRVIAEREGLRPPADDSRRHGLQDVGSEARTELIYQMQTGSAYGYANWKSGNDADALQAAPAQELVRIRSARKPRDWDTRWEQAGNKVGWAGAIRSPKVALKTSPIWTAISRFDRPYPPFDFGSGMWVEDVDRETSLRLGLVARGEPLQPARSPYSASLQASAKDLSPELRQSLRSLFGPQIQFDGDTIKWNANVHDYERDTRSAGEVARQVFTRSASDVGQLGRRIPGAQAPGGLAEETPYPAQFAETNAVEISAVATGRKPLFHERLGFLMDAGLAQRLQAGLPEGTVARATAEAIFVYNERALRGLADPARDLWDQIREHRDDGRWLGYGVDARAVGVPRVLVNIIDPAGEAVSGFWAPAEQGELYALARLRDWLLVRGPGYRARIRR